MLVSVTVRYIFAALSIPWASGSLRIAVRCACRVGLHVLNTAASIRNNSPDVPNHFFALAIGVVFIAGGYAVGNISGPAVNPAVAIVLDVSSFDDGVQRCFA